MGLLDYSRVFGFIDLKDVESGLEVIEERGVAFVGLGFRIGIVF